MFRNYAWKTSRKHVILKVYLLRIRKNVVYFILQVSTLFFFFYCAMASKDYTFCHSELKTGRNECRFSCLSASNLCSLGGWNTLLTSSKVSETLSKHKVHKVWTWQNSLHEDLFEIQSAQLLQNLGYRRLECPLVRVVSFLFSERYCSQRTGTANL